MQLRTEGGLRTRIYIDGYNLYFGCLKNSPNKWLDVRVLIENILPSVLYERDDAEVTCRFVEPAVKYFTSSILQAFARSEDSVTCQAHYHSALSGHLGSQLEIIKGYYDARPARAHSWEEGKSARECQRVDVWKLEEKQSDVALALHAYSDAVRNEVDQIIAITNDTDFEPAMQMIRRDTDKVIGLIAPIRPSSSKVNAQLGKHAHWTRKHILEEEFAASQLPQVVRNGTRVNHKPLSWYRRPDLLIPIYEEAKRVRRSHGSAMKWLGQPCERLGGRTPLRMAESDDEARDLWQYMTEYAREFG